MQRGHTRAEANQALVYIRQNDYDWKSTESALKSNGLGDVSDSVYWAWGNAIYGEGAVEDAMAAAYNKSQTEALTTANYFLNLYCSGQLFDDRLDTIVVGGGGNGEQKISNILANKTFTNSTGKVNNYTSPEKGQDVAKKDFFALNPTNVRKYETNTGTTIVGDLPNGNTLNIHTGTSTNGPTLEIFDRSADTSIKIRY